MIVGVLAELPVTAIVATADRVRLGAPPANVSVRSFVRGAEVARRARLVISNGGSTTGYQALSQGTPVLGLPSNLDQYLATEAIVRAGAGRCIKARQAKPEALRSTILGMLEDSALQDAARRVAARFRSLDSANAFRGFVQQTLALRAKSSAR
jgi:UDP:flavonoid glycosyltransferase YjiC (YdhE family)